MSLNWNTCENYKMQVLNSFSLKMKNQIKSIQVEKIQIGINEFLKLVKQNTANLGVTRFDILDSGSDIIAQFVVSTKRKYFYT